MTQLNTPYPATAYLTGFLRQHAERLQIEVAQADAAIELFLRVFSSVTLQRIYDELSARAAVVGDDSDMPDSIAHFLEAGPRYVETIDVVVKFLQGRDPGVALRIIGRELLPEGPRFAALNESDDDDPLAWAFGGLGIADRAKHLASLYIDDLADVIRDGIEPDFELSRYGERLAASAPTFDPLHETLEGEPTIIDDLLDGIAEELFIEHKPDLVGLTAPFPGNVYGAFRIARKVKALAPHTVTVLGGGYVNTELRELSEPRVFDYFDYITVDDGETPMLALIDHVRDRH